MAAKTGIPQFMGVRIKRREDPALITGQGKYVGDIQLEKTLYMALVRSPYAHAEILSIDASEAKALAGVVTVLTGEDINPNLAQPLPMVIPIDETIDDNKNPKRYPLTTDKVRHVGDPVAVVVAEDPYTLADAVEMVYVDYEPLPVVVDPEAALADDAPIIHWDNNIGYQWSDSGGKVDQAFAQADTLVELRLVNQRLIPNAMEPRVVLADYDTAADALTVWTSTQIPHGVQEHLVEIFEMPPEKIRVIAPEVGGGFGAKSNLYGEEVLVPYLARQLGRPVKWTASRSEDFLTTSHGRDQINIIRLAADSDGKVKGADLKVILDCGGYYTRVTPIIAILTGQMMTGVYDIRNARIEATGVFTNKHPSEPYRGAGRPEAAFLIERAMDLLAQELGIDPAEIRRRNFIAPDNFPYTTPTKSKYDSGDYATALEKALALIDYDRLRAEQARSRQNDVDKLVGVGMASYVEVCGFGPWEAGSVTVDTEGKATILTGTSPHGQGHHTTWAQIAADALQIPMEDITVKHGDTKEVPRGIGTFGSRSAPVGGSAVLNNADAVRERALQIAAHVLEAAAADMTLMNGRFQVRGVPEQSLSWAEVAQAAASDDLPEELRGDLTSDENFEPPGETYPFGVHICVVEIDKETGSVAILRYVTVDDCGRVINPLVVEGQVHGGIAQGIGQALLEAAVYDETGNLMSGSLMDYALPRAGNFPLFETHRTETPSPLNPLGVKGIGEAATIGSTPCVVNAVVDALAHLGIRHVNMPLTPEKIWQTIQNASGI